jgi:uncharacterized membrane protein
MKTKLNPKMELLLLLISIIPIIVTVALLSKIPDQVPIHWNLKGEIDGYGSKWLSPIMTIGFYLLFLGMMFIDPKKGNYEKFMGLLYKIRLILTLFFTMVVCLTISAAMGEDVRMDRVLLISVPLLFAFIGNTIISIKPNWFIGVRTPWTLENETVWRKTHRLTGLLWFWAGLLCATIGFFVKTDTGFIVLLVVTSVIIVVPLVYSYLIYRREPKVINKKDF